MDKETDKNPFVNQGVQEKHVSTAALVKIAGELSSDDLEFCKKETKRLVDLLSPKQLAWVISMGVYLIDLLGAEKAGEVIIAKLVMNRRPKEKSINEMTGTILEVGPLIMPLVLPAVVAIHFGYEIEDFDNNPIPEDKLSITVVIIDGQTRYLAIKEIRSKYPDKVPSKVYAYFPLHWTSLTKMLQAINLKVFTWKNSDFITGVLGCKKIDKQTNAALEYIKKLEREEYNFTSACEWVILQNGIIKKTLLVNAINSSGSGLKLDNAGYGMEIHKTALEVFKSDKEEKALKNKTIPELIIKEWNAACENLSKKEATGYIKAFLNSLTSDEISEMVSPSGYKRGEGKKKEAFVKEQFDESFKSFKEAHPYTDFRESFKTTGL